MTVLIKNDKIIIMKIKATDKIYFFNFKTTGEKDGDFFITINGNAILIDHDSEHIIKLLQKHHSIENILKNTKYYTKKEIQTRINNFLEIKIIKKIGSKKFKNEHIKLKNDLPFIKQNFAKLFFSIPVKTLLILLIAFSFIITITNLNYLPKYEDFFFNSNYLLCLLVSFTYSWLSTFRHEFFHFLAARSRNIVTSFGISSRANYIVAETIFENAYTIKEKNRYRLYLSGIFSDLFFLGIYLLIIFLNNTSIIHISNMLYLLLKSFILIEFLGIIWQFLIFIKTDIYLFFADLLDRENLMEESKKYYLNIVKNKKQKKDLLLLIFGLFVFLGLIVIIGRYITFDIPIKIKVIEDSFNYLIATALSGKSINLLKVISYTLAMFIQIFEIIIIIFFAIRKKIKKETAE